MANRAKGPPPSDLTNATDAFSRASLGESFIGRANSYPTHSHPTTGRGGGVAGGLANKRLKLGLKLSDINGDVGGGAAGAGLGAGRPSLAGPAPRRPPSNFGSPFSNFGKIV